MDPDRQKVWMDRWNGRRHGRRQNYIPPTSSGDNRITDTFLKYKCGRAGFFIPALNGCDIYFLNRNAFFSKVVLVRLFHRLVR